MRPKNNAPPKAAHQEVASAKILLHPHSNIIVVDTNVLIQDPVSALSEFLKSGNLVVIPWWVFMEIDHLKKSSVSHEARTVIKKIESLMSARANIVIELNEYYAQCSQLDKSIPDHRIIATLRYVAKNMRRPNSQYYGYNKLKFISNDEGMRIMANIIMSKAVNLSIDSYQKDQTKLSKDDLILKTLNVPYLELKQSESNRLSFSLPKSLKLLENSGVIVYADKDSSWQPIGVAVRKQKQMVVLNNQIKASGITPRSNGHANWEQIMAFNFLLDPSISCVFLQGGAGTGKTLLALASAMELCKRNLYTGIVISTPPIPLDKESDLGFLPGNIYDKFTPWILPIFQNIALITNNPIYLSPNATLSDLAKINISIAPPGYMRGQTLSKVIFIIDEAQNLTAHQIKTIITRAGEGVKLIFTGDLTQIDRAGLTASSSGLAYAIRRMKGNPMVGIVNLSAVVRSPLVEYANKVL